MRLVTRLWLWGAAVPLAVVLATLAMAGFFFRGMLERSVDRALVAQAATESVSLFDAPDGRPHLHVENSPLAREVLAFVPTTWLYQQDGTLVSVYPPDAAHVLGERLRVPEGADAGVLETRFDAQGQALRVYTFALRSPEGEPFVLQLATHLAPVDEALRVFVLTALGTVVSLGLVLAVAQAWQARRLSGRLLHIRRQMDTLREGKPLHSHGPQRHRDEIAEVQEALEDTAARLNAARAAQEHLVARAAHELRTPLALMRTTLDLALRRERPASELREALDETRREVERLSQVAATLLELSAPDAEHRPLQAWPLRDLREVAEEAVAAAQAQARLRQVTLELEGPVTAPAHAEPQSMRRALDNLLSNALRYAPAHSQVKVSLNERSGGGWDVCVEDEGPGIDRAHREEVFEPFVRLEADGEGAGLGLSLVREVARRHGGDARVADTPRGARIVVELPHAGP